MPWNYLKVLLIAILIGLIGLPIFNLAIDPYGVFHSATIPNLNEVKLADQIPIREAKTLMLNRIKPDVVFLGTSRALRGFDPEHRLLENGRKFNYAVTNARLDEILAQLRYAHKNHYLKQAVITLDFFIFNSTFPMDNSFGDFLQSRPMKQAVKLLWTFETFKSSLWVMTHQEKKQMSRYTENGLQIIQNRGQGANIKKFKQITGLYLDTKFFPGTSCAYAFERNGSSTLRTFKEILDFAHENNIKLAMPIPPDHAWMMEGIYQIGLGDAYETWLRELAKINEDSAREHGKEPFELWDFSGYTDVTTESVPAKESGKKMANYQDPAHFFPHFGAVMLDKMFGNKATVQKPESLGTRIDSQTIQKHIAKLHADRHAYIATHADDVGIINDLVRHARSSHARRCTEGVAVINAHTGDHERT